MKKYFFEATKRQWEKPTEPKQYLCAPAKITVLAESEEQAFKLAKEKLHDRFVGTGTVLGEVRLAGCAQLAEDWSYGYGDKRGTGTDEDKKAIMDDCKGGL